MTQHEQKPESADFRTREAQRAALAEMLENGMPAYASQRAADREVTEAEARGAAEQRRKDAEGQDTVRQYQTSDWRWEDAVNDKTWEMAVAANAERRTLYTRPANVAALEARVKELEAQLGAMQHGAVRQVIHSPLRHFKPEDRS